MPPLYGEMYGEGEFAFLRLQLEILKVSDDESIFAWEDEEWEEGNSPESGLLASSPAAFKHAGTILHIRRNPRPSYSITNNGLAIELTLLCHWSLQSSPHSQSPADTLC